MQRFSTNGLWKPDMNLIGVPVHQPKGFDQLMLWFQNYTVIGSKIVIQTVQDRFINQTIPFIHGLITDTTASATAGRTAEDILESRQAGKQWRTTGNANWQNGTFPTKLTKTFSAKKFFTKKVMGDPNMQGNDQQNPPEDCYFIHWSQGVDHTLNADPLQFIATIEYIAVFHEPRIMPQST